MISVALEYCVELGKCDVGDWIEWEVELDGAAEEAYKNALMLRLPFRDYPELEAVLSDAYEEIEKAELEILLDMDDEYTQECMGKYLVDPDEINLLIAKRDPHALDYFGLTELSDRELDSWDANDLEELPDVCDFQESYEAYSPFDEGWTLHVEYAEKPDEDDLERDEAAETLAFLFENAKGSFGVVRDYIERCSELYCDDDLQELANEIASELGISGFSE